jgi:transcriptional regulator with XRE-family HTH domain
LQIKEVFAGNLRALCAARRASVNTIAQAIGISRTQLDRYLNGDHLPNDLNLKKISAYFGISEVQLYSASAPSVDNRSELVDAACRAVARGLFGAASPTLAAGDYQTLFTLASNADQVMVSLTLVRRREAKTVFRRLTRFASGGAYQGDHEGFVIERLDGYYFLGVNRTGAREPSLALMRRLPVAEMLLGGRSLVTSERGPAVSALLMRPLAPGGGLREGLRQMGIVGIDSPLIGPLEAQFLRSLLNAKA